MALTNIPVTLGKGLLSKVLAKLSNDSSAGVYFGYNDELNSGVIVAGGKLVSSKILDISVNNSEASTGISNIVIKYLNAVDKTIDTKTFEVVSYDGVNSIISSVLYNEDTSIGKVINTLQDSSFISSGNDESTQKNSGIVVTPETNNATGVTTYTIKVNTDSSTIFINANGQLSVDTYKLEKSETVVNPENTAEYIFTTKHADGSADSTVTIEIPVALAIKTANLSKYILGSELTDEEKSKIIAAGGTVDESSYYEINLDTDTPTKVDSLPSQVTVGQTYIHFEWGGESATPTFLNVADIAVNYTGSKYINVENNVIKLNYSTLLSDINSSLGIEIINASINKNENDIININNNINDISTKVENIDASLSSYIDINNTELTNINSSINNLSEKVNTNELAIDDISTGYAALSLQISDLSTAIGSDTTGETLSEKINNVDTSVANIKEEVTALDSSVSNISDILNGADAILYTEEEANTENDRHLINDADNNAPGTPDYNTTYEDGYNPVEAGDIKTPSTAGLVEDVNNLDSSITVITNNITNIDTSILNLYNKLSWIDLDA